MKKPSEQLASLRKTFEEKRHELRTRLAKAENATESAWRKSR